MSIEQLPNSKSDYLWPRLRVWTSNLSLRKRLAIMSGILIVTLNLGLVLFINTVATVQVSDAETAPITAPTLDVSTSTWRPGQPTVTPGPVSNAYDGPVTTADTHTIRHNLLGQLRVNSLIGLVLTAVLGSFAAYWMASKALRPLGQVSQLARSITADSLDRRITLTSQGEEVQELSDALDMMLSRLEQSFTKQGQFVSDAAHELRTPLATLRTNLEVVEADSDVTLDDYREMTPVLERTLTRLERLVGNLLVMAAGDQSLVYEQIVLEQLIKDVLADLSYLAEQQGVELDLSCRSTSPDMSQAADARDVVWGDGVLLSRVFSNLIENSIRYNRAGGRVQVEVEPNASDIAVSVIDTGIGIPPEEQSRIFDRLYRADRSRNKGGAGLGLSIVSHIVRLHGGTVEVESAPGKGSCFRVRLPQRPAAIPGNLN